MLAFPGRSVIVRVHFAVGNSQAWRFNPYIKSTVLCTNGGTPLVNRMELTSSLVAGINRVGVLLVVASWANWY